MKTIAILIIATLLAGCASRPVTAPAEPGPGPYSDRRHQCPSILDWAEPAAWSDRYKLYEKCMADTWTYAEIFEAYYGKPTFAMWKEQNPEAVRKVSNRYTRTVTAQAKPRGGYAAICPCSSSANCTGPRGGRFCMTSGGRKRYR